MMARYATIEKQYDCPSPSCEVRFTEREAVVIRKTHLVCPKCYGDTLHKMHEGPLYALRLLVCSTACVRTQEDDFYLCGKKRN